MLELNKNYFWLIILILIIVIFFLASLEKNPKVNLVNPERFENIIRSEDVFVINAHTPYIGEIDKTDLIAENWENMGFYKDDLPKDKNVKIAIYCRSGRMSANSASQLIGLGYKNVYELDGGMNSWQESGRELIFRR